MARPAGRYFASVIAKIRDAKKKEQIVVDDGFKLQLRQQVMMKISAQVQPERVSWMERLAPFKSYLGVVPALAFVIVAVVGISKLPIDFKSNVIVPVSDTSQENVEQIQPTVDDQPASSVSGDTTGGIKTFPGRFVIPSNYFSGNQGSTNVLQDSQPQTSPVSADLQAVEVPQTSAASNVSEQSAVPQTSNEQKTEQKVVTITNVPNQILQYFAFQPGQDFSNVGEGNVVPPPSVQPVTSASAPIVLPSVSGSTLLNGQTEIAQTPSSVSGSTPTIPAGDDVKDVSESTTVAETTIQDSPITSISQTVYTAYRVEVPTKNISDTSVQSNPIQTFYFNEIAALPPQDLDLNVYYNGKFSSDERTVLERAVLPHLVNGDDVDYVNVYQKDSSTIVIELNYKDGTDSSFDYKVNDSGSWELIQSSAQDYSMHD